MTDDAFAGRETVENRNQGITVGDTLSAALARLRDDPLLAVPFALAGVVLSLLDWLRELDPIPTVAAGGARETTVGLEFQGYPTGAPATARRVGALIDLEPSSLGWAVGLELVALLAVAVAGWYTIVRAAALERTARGLASYVGFVVLIVAAGRLLGSIGDVTLPGLTGLAVFLLVILVVLVAFARLFLAPGLAVAGSTPPRAIRRSVQLTGGSTGPLVVLVLLYGLAAWLLGSVPQVGALVSSAVVAPVHALSIVVVLERLEWEP